MEYNINLDVYSDYDDKEISFLSEEYDITKINLSISEGEKIIYIDGNKSSFDKSIKLKKGYHNVTFILEGKIHSCQNMFKNCRDIQTIYFNISNECNNMEFMFSGCSSLISVNTENLNTSEVISMNNMFSGCKSLKSLDLYNFDTSKVTNMIYMFYNSTFESINLSHFNTSLVTDMFGMFSKVNVSSLDLSSFNTSLVKNMSYMFSEIIIESLNLSSFDTKSVENMSYMFDSSEIISLNLSNFNMQKVTDVSGMFSSCLNLEDLDLWKFNPSSIIKMDYMFQNTNFKSIDLSNINTTGVKSMVNLFYNSVSLKIINFGSSFDTSQVTSMSGMFGFCKSLESLNLSSFNTNKVLEMNYMFSWCTNLISINISNFNMSQVVN